MGLFWEVRKKRDFLLSLLTNRIETYAEKMLFLLNGHGAAHGSAVAATKKKAPDKVAPAGNLYAFVGTDDGRVKEEALKLCQDLSSPDAGDFGNDIIEGGADNSDDAVRIINETIQALQTLPFFGEKVVWLKGANFLGDSVTGRAAATLEAIERLTEMLVAGFPDSVKFILSASQIDKRRAFYKKVSKLANIRVFDTPDLGKDGWEEEAMLLVRERARLRHVEFAQEALERFVMLAGADTRQIENEVEKLDLYLGEGERAVTTAVVKQLVSLSRAGVVFELGSAIEQRNLPYALELIDQLLYRGESAIGILLAAIVPRVRNLLLAKDLQERLRVGGSNYQSYIGAVNRLPASETAHIPKTKEGKINGYPLFLASRWARGFTSEQLRDGMNACLTANRQLVTSQLDHKLVLNRLVVRLLVGY